MNFSKKNRKLVGQNENGFKKPQKHDANLQKNTTLYFQVGLILVLLLTYGLFEMNFQTKKIDLTDYAIKIDDESEIYVKEYKVLDETKKQETKQEKKQKRVILNPVIKNDDFGGKETPNIITPDDNLTGKSLNPDDVIVIDEPEDVVLGLDFVKEVPIYPGCEKYKTNKAKKKCMSDKIGKLVARKFNTGIASKIGLQGIQRINVLFRIDAQGNVAEIKAQSNYSDLVDEAERVVKKIPQMIPGKDKGKKVSVLYTLPILFEVR